MGVVAEEVLRPKEYDMHQVELSVGWALGALTCLASFWLGWLARGAMKRFVEIARR